MKFQILLPIPPPSLPEADIEQLDLYRYRSVGMSGAAHSLTTEELAAYARQIERDAIPRWTSLMPISCVPPGILVRRS